MKNDTHYRLFQVLSLIWIVGFFSCKSDQHYDLPEVPIPSQTKSKIMLADIAKEVKIIPLETNRSSYISKINDVSLHNNMLFIRFPLQPVKVFDLNGDFIGQLGKQGEGPGEYESASALAVHPESGEIFLFAYNKFMRFSSELMLLEENKLTFSFDYLNFFGDEMIGVSQEYGLKTDGGFINETNLYRFNLSGDIKDTLNLRKVFLEKKIATALGYTDYASNLFGNQFLYVPVTTNESFLRDTLYNFENMKLHPFVKLIFPKPHVDERGFKKYHIANIVNTKNYLSSHIYYNEGGLHHFLYHKENQQGYLVDKGFIDDSGEEVMLRVLIPEDNLFYFVKRTPYQAGSLEEPNPSIGLVWLK
jgi:hypothetical protein